MILRKRLLFKHIQPRAADFAAAQSFQQGVRVHDAATRDVDKKGVLLHLAESFRVKHMIGFVGQRKRQDNKIALGKDGVNCIAVLACKSVTDVIHPAERKLIEGIDFHPECLQALREHPPVVAHADDAGFAAVKPFPCVRAVDTPVSGRLRSQQFLRMIAMLQHEIDRVLRKNRSASARGTGDNEIFREDLVPRGTVEPRVVAGDPFERVLPEKTVVDVAEQNRDIRVLRFLREFFLVIEIYVDKVRFGKNIPQRMIIFLVVPDGRDNFSDFRHFASFPASPDKPGNPLNCSTV